MRTSHLSMALAACVVAIPAHAQFVGWRALTDFDPDSGNQTLGVYAAFAGPNAPVTAVHCATINWVAFDGDPISPLHSDFLGGSFDPRFTTGAFDTYVTIGAVQGFSNMTQPDVNWGPAGFNNGGAAIPPGAGWTNAAQGTVTPLFWLESTWGTPVAKFGFDAIIPFVSFCAQMESDGVVHSDSRVFAANNISGINGCYLIPYIGPHWEAISIPTSRLYRVVAPANGESWSWRMSWLGTERTFCTTALDGIVGDDLAVAQALADAINQMSLRMECDEGPWPKGWLPEDRLGAEVLVSAEGHAHIVVRAGDFAESRIDPATWILEASGPECPPAWCLPPTAPGSPCVGAIPLAEIALSYTDCDRNGIDDTIDILLGTLADLNGNGVPDACETTHFIGWAATTDFEVVGDTVLPSFTVYATFDGPQALMTAVRCAVVDVITLGAEPISLHHSDFVGGSFAPQFTSPVGAVDTFVTIGTATGFSNLTVADDNWGPMGFNNGGQLIPSGAGWTNVSQGVPGSGWFDPPGSVWAVPVARLVIGSGELSVPFLSFCARTESDGVVSSDSRLFVGPTIGDIQPCFIIPFVYLGSEPDPPPSSVPTSRLYRVTAAANGESSSWRMSWLGTERTFCMTDLDGVADDPLGIADALAASVNDMALRLECAQSVWAEYWDVADRLSAETLVSVDGDAHVLIRAGDFAESRIDPATWILEISGPECPLAWCLPPTEPVVPCVDAMPLREIALSHSDCDRNGVDDTIDILLGTMPDLNGNGVPDVCEAPGDLDGDGVVDGADLGILLNAWGACVGCPADLDGDGVVDGADLGMLLNAWSR